MSGHILYTFEDAWKTDERRVERAKFVREPPSGEWTIRELTIAANAVAITQACYPDSDFAFFIARAALALTGTRDHPRRVQDDNLRTHHCDFLCARTEPTFGTISANFRLRRRRLSRHKVAGVDLDIAQIQTTKALLESSGLVC